MSTPLRDASVLVLVTRDGMGHAEQPLRHRLIRNYLGLLEGNGMLPGAIAFYGEGVRLVVEGSPVLDHLASLEAKGVHLVVCKTCLDEYGLVDKVRVGVIGGMSDIVAAQWKAAKVITI
jgi:intracellular sulfur oxidation DsrE/DsrF family protein